MTEKRPLVVVQVRSSSKRLPGKAHLPLDHVPMLAYLIRRLKYLPESYRIVVATTRSKEDDATQRCAVKEGVDVIRGEESDVLARYMRCTETFPSEIIVRVTADNPLTDPGIITAVVDEMKKGGYDYVRAIEGFAQGLGVDAFRDSLMRTIESKTDSPYDREHVDAFIIRHMDDYKVKTIKAPEKLAYPDIKLTVDTREDYEKMLGIIGFFPSGHYIKSEDAVRRVLSKGRYSGEKYSYM